MFYQVIPSMEHKYYDYQDGLFKYFINKECEVCGDKCEWGEDIKQYYRCCHYCCPYALYQIPWCINCGCKVKRVHNHYNSL